MPKPEPIELVFELEAETKNKRRFQEMSEVGPDNKKPEPVTKDKAVVEKLYVRKSALKKMGDPTTLRVRLEAP